MTHSIHKHYSMNCMLGIFLKFSWQHWEIMTPISRKGVELQITKLISQRVKTHVGPNRQILTPPATQARDKCGTVARYGSDNLVLRTFFWKKHNWHYFDSASESNCETSPYLRSWIFHSSLQYFVSSDVLFSVTCSGRYHQYQREETSPIISSYTSQYEATRAETAITPLWHLQMKRYQTLCWMLTPFLQFTPWRQLLLPCYRRLVRLPPITPAA